MTYTSEWPEGRELMRCRPGTSDPVFFVCDTMEYGFWDETWSYAYGPYANERAARIALASYIKENGL